MEEGDDLCTENPGECGAANKPNREGKGQVSSSQFCSPSSMCAVGNSPDAGIAPRTSRQGILEVTEQAYRPNSDILVTGLSSLRT